MFCEKCGKQVNDTATFCRFCGASTDAADAAAPDSSPDGAPSGEGTPSMDAQAPGQVAAPVSAVSSGSTAPPGSVASLVPAAPSGPAQTGAKQTGFYIPRQMGTQTPPPAGFPPAASPRTFAAPPGPAQPNGYQGPQPGYPQPGYPQTGYQYQAPPRPKRKSGATVVIVLLCVLLAGAAGFIIWIYFGQGKDALAGQMDEDLSAEVARYFEDPPSSGTSTYTRDGSGGQDWTDYDESDEPGGQPQTGGQAGYPAGQPSGNTPAPPPAQSPTPPPAQPPAQNGYSTSVMPNSTEEFEWYTGGYFGDGFPDGAVFIDDWSAITGGWKAALWIDPFRDDYPTSALVMMNINISGSPGNATADLRYGNLYDEDGSVIDWSELDDTYTGGSFEYGELTVGPDYDEFNIYTFYEYRGTQYAVGWNSVSSGVQIYIAMYR